MAKPGDAICARCGGWRTIPGWVQGVGNRGAPCNPSFQFTFPTTWLGILFTRGDWVAVDQNFDSCLDCGLLWTNIDPAGIEGTIRKATGKEVFGDQHFPAKPIMPDDELQGPK